MNRNELHQYYEMIKTVLLNSAVKINKWCEKFMFEVLLLYLIIPGRINFLQLGRHEVFGEQCYYKFCKGGSVEEGNSSINDVCVRKVLCHNLFLMQRFISLLGIKPNKEINRRLWEEEVRFTTIAA